MNVASLALTNATANLHVLTHVVVQTEGHRMVNCIDLMNFIRFLKFPMVMSILFQRGWILVSPL